MHVQLTRYSPPRGITVYMFLYVLIALSLVRVSHLSSQGNHDKLGALRYLAFLGDKYETGAFSQSTYF